MEAYESEDKEKGLFTFYRQQAEQEDKIKQRKKEHLAKMRQLQMQAQAADLTPDQITHKNITKTSQKPKKQQVQQKKQIQKQQAKIESGKQDKQFQKRLLQILEKHKYGRNKRRNFKLVVKMGNNDQIALKYHLQALMLQQNQINKHENGKDKNDIFTHKKAINSAFSRVALCPTNFETELDQNILNYGKNVISKKLGNVSSANPRKLDRVYDEIRPKENKQTDVSQILQRNLLPKLNIKNNNLPSSNSVCFNKEEYQSARDRIVKPVIGSVPLHNLSKIKSSRDKSLCVESARYKNDSKIKQSGDNRIYPIFIENNQSKKCEQQIKIDKQKMFVQIIRKLKFK